MWCDGGGWHDGMGTGSWIVAGVMLLLFWAAIVFGVVWLVRGTRAGHPGGPGDRARQILDERFARGEMTEEEYRQRRDLLNSR